MMRRLGCFSAPLLFATPSAGSARRWCSTSGEMGEGIAPKKAKKGRSIADNATSVNVAKASEMPSDPKVEAELSTADVERKIKKLAEIPEDKLNELMAKFDEKENAASKVLEEDSLYQMDLSLEMRQQGGVRVFWKDVSVAESTKFKNWYHVTVDRRPVKAFETKAQLIVPGEEFAHAVAAEWGKQENFLNKLSMPLTDLASGAHHVSPQMIAPRIGYLMSFFKTDNCYFRSEMIQDKQDKLIDPIAEWYGRVYDFEVPRVVGISHPHPSSEVENRVRESLHALNMNQYQIVALCVMAQCTASLMLPLALVNRVTTLAKAMEINRAEEGHNVASEGIIEGYHDIRDCDQVVKLAAAACGWHFTKDLPLAQCSAALMSVAQQRPDDM